MNVTQLVLVAAMVVYAIYRQTRIGRADGPGRFKLALIYGAVALVSFAVSGWQLPEGAGWILLAAGISVSLVAGIARGYLTRVWIDADGHAMRQGTWLTISLFVLVIAIKVGMAVWAGFAGIETASAFGTTLLVVAVMIAVQAEIVARRAAALTTRLHEPAGV